MRQYIGIIHQDSDSDFGISFPDFPGCISAGSTLDELHSMAAEALQFHVEGLVEDGEAIPEPTSLEVAMQDPNNRDGVAILVPLLGGARKSVRVNITLPDDTLREIDSYAESHGYSRSGFLVTAARKAMEAA